MRITDVQPQNINTDVDTHIEINSFPATDGVFRLSVFSLLYVGGAITQKTITPDQNTGGEEAETSDRSIA